MSVQSVERTEEKIKSLTLALTLQVFVGRRRRVQSIPLRQSFLEFALFQLFLSKLMPAAPYAQLAWLDRKE